MELILPQPKLKSLNLGYRTDHPKQKRRQTEEKNLRTTKKSIEGSWRANDVDCSLQTRQSYAKRQEQRLLTSFESKETAKHQTRKREEEAGLRAKKRHSPDPSTIDFEKEALLAEVNNIKQGDQVFAGQSRENLDFIYVKSCQLFHYDRKNVGKTSNFICEALSTSQIKIVISFSPLWVNLVFHTNSLESFLHWIFH